MKSPQPARSKRSVDPKYLLTWEVSGREYCGAIEAHIRPYVDVLGVEGTLRLLLEWGGSSVYLADRRPQKGGKLCQFIGPEAVTALAVVLGGSRHVSFPTANKFIARAMRARKHSVGEISRCLRRTETTTRKLLTDPSCAVESGASS